MTQAKHRALFVGCGGAAARTAARFSQLPGTSIVALVDPVAGAAERIAAPPETPTFTDLDDALEHCDANIAFIASPNAFHAEQFIRCAERGLHVWIEKPAALTVEDALAMERVAERQGIKTMTPYMCEQDTFLADAVAAFRAGTFGPLVQVMAVRTGSNGFFGQGFGGHSAVLNPDVSGGWILHHLCHVVDWALCMGGPVSAVTCRSHSTVPHARPDSRHEEAVTCMLAFESGGVACLVENQLRHKYHRYAVVGERGGIFIDHYPKAQAGQTMLGIDTEVDGKTVRRRLSRDRTIAESDTRTSAVQRLIDAIEQDLPSPVDMSRNVHVLSVCLALTAATSARDQWINIHHVAPSAEPC